MNLLLFSDMLTVRWILLCLPLCVLRINGFLLSVTRGYQDSIYTNNQQESTPRLTCNNSGHCKCKDGLTYIFDKRWSGKCVRDYKIIEDRSKGKLLRRWRRCIGVTEDEEVKNMGCNENNLSVKWIRTINEQMLNLKTLTCLTVKTKKRKKILTMDYCSTNVPQQKWVCTDSGYKNEANNKTWRISKRRNESNASYINCSENTFYKGCYRFSDGNHVKLMSKTGCETLHNETCCIKIQAPIISTGYTSTCKLDWVKSTYTISGHRWYSFNGTKIAGVQLNATTKTTTHPVILQIKNISSLLSAWEGHLLKLTIKCTDDAGRSESHCALFKVNGTATEKIQVSISPRTPIPFASQMTSQTTSQPRSTTFEYRRINTSSKSTPFQKVSSTNTSHPNVNSQDEEENKDSPMILLIVITAVALFCSMLSLVVMVIVCKRRKRKKDDANQNEEHIYEEPQPVNDNGPASPIYMEIDDVARRKSKKSNAGSQKRNKSQSSEATPENPLYHTLERPDRVEINADIYEEVDNAPKPPDPKPKPEFEKEIDI